MTPRWYLALGDELATWRSPDPFATKAEAIAEFRAGVAEQISYGDTPEPATLHRRDERQHDEPKFCEEPEYRLSVGPRGGVRIERC